MLEGAMDFLSCCSAIILDLRRNTGGNNRMIQRFMSYFFENQVPITGQYTRESGGIREYSTLENFHHRYLVDIPLFVLVSSKTVSGPEEVAYDLHVEKRAVIIGEKTKGAANPSYFYRIKEKLLVCIPYGYAVHPKTKSNWEGTGVAPDVMVPADSALTTAVELAREAAEKVKKREQDRVDSLVAVLSERMKQIEPLLVSEAPEAEHLFERTLDEFYEIEYMNKYLLLEWFDSYKAAGNDAACAMVGKQGILRYPDEDRFYSRLGDLYSKKGDLENALKTYSDLLSLNPNDISAKKKIEEIQKEMQ
jgi:tetratricopeptide (TPR) repeat protein